MKLYSTYTIAAVSSFIVGIILLGKPMNGLRIIAALLIISDLMLINLSSRQQNSYCVKNSFSGYNLKNFDFLRVFKDIP